MKNQKDQIKKNLEDIKDWCLYLKNHNHKPKNEKEQNDLDEIHDELKSTIDFLNDIQKNNEKIL